MRIRKWCNIRGRHNKVNFFLHSTLSINPYQSEQWQRMDTHESKGCPFTYNNLLYSFTGLTYTYKTITVALNSLSVTILLPFTLVKAGKSKQETILL